MTSPAKFKKDKEIIAEYDTQVKGKEWFYFHPFTASLPGDCRSLQWMFGWGRGKSFADCLEFAGLFLGIQSWVGFAVLCLSPWGSSCFGVAVFKVPQRGYFFLFFF